MRNQLFYSSIYKMVKVTDDKEWQQFEKHNFDKKRDPQDKAYQTFLKTIFNSDGELNHIGGKDIPESIAQICRVLEPFSGKEFLIYDVNQYGYYEDGTQTPNVYVQDLGVYKNYKWKKEAIQEIQKDLHQKTKFKDIPSGFDYVYEIEFNQKNLEELKKKSTPKTALYVYDLGVSGKGGKDGKIAVSNWEDFKNRTFKELLEGTYLIQSQLQKQLEAVKQRENAINLREQLLEQEEQQQKQFSKK